MKSLGGGHPRGIVPNEAGISAEACIRCALSQPIAALVTGMISMAKLRQHLAIARDFLPMNDAAQQKLLAKVKEVAGDGRYERFKSTTDFDGSYHRKQHGFRPR